MAARQKSKVVTVVVRHRILNGKERDFEDWIQKIERECSRYKGYLGTELVHTQEQECTEYVVIFRFDQLSHLKRWMDSDVRKKLLNQVGKFLTSDRVLTQYDSLGYWFDSVTERSPEKYKMMTVTLIAIWPLVHFILPLIKGKIPGPVFFQEVLTSALLVGLMTYLMMPLMTRVFSRWLQRPPRKKS